jgi:FkbM family methyltransferase
LLVTVFEEGQPVADGRSELEELLSEPVGEAQRRAAESFDRLSGGRHIVLMGAGGLGRRTLAGLRRRGVEPLAFADNAIARQGTTLEGLPVLSPETAAREFGPRAAFVVTIWGANSPHRFAQSREQLRSLGCDVVSSFPALFWKYPEALLPFYLQDLPSRLLDDRVAVLRAFDLWEDDASRAEYVAQVRFRLSADFDGLSHPVGHPQYFPDDLFTWSGDEWIVDGGAYDGDTVRMVSTMHGDRFGHHLALEPDPANFIRLQETVAALSPGARVKVDCRQVALGSERRTLHLDATGTAASATSVVRSAGTIAVNAETLDSLVDGARPTFIKLDIEGFEMEALQGARKTIQRHAPVLAVCVYHRQNHLWRIPLLLRELRDDYAFFLRPHNEEGWDLVCYAVARARLTRHTP